MEAATPIRSTHRPRTRHDTLARLHSRLMLALCVAAALAIVGLLALITGYLLSLGLSSLTPALFTQLPTGRVDHPGGLLNGIVGTLLLVSLASAIGIPLGTLAGVFLSEYSATSRRLAPAVRFTADVLAGVPSIVVGILGYELLVAPLGHYSGYAGAFALAFLMVPIVARTTEEMLRLVPNSYREASIALGATKARTILKVVIPAAAGSLVTGAMLAVARAAGETAPLLFTALGSRLLTLDPNQPFPSLTVQIYTYATGPYEQQRKLAWAGILVLILLILLLNLTVRTLASRRQTASASH